MFANFLTDLQNILISENDVLSKEEQLVSLSSRVMNYLLNQYIKLYEPAILQKYQAQGYSTGKNAERSVYFLFGEITYARTPLEKNGHIVYPIDELLGLERYSRYSVGAKYALVSLSMVTSYRKSAELIETIADVTASKDTVMKIVHEYGEKYKNYETYLEEYGTKGTKTVDYLYIEGDGVFIGGRDGKNRELAHFIVHEGIETNGNRKCTKNLKQFVGLGHRKTLNQLENYLYRTYNLKNTTIVSNADGGKGYTQATFKSLLPSVKRHEHFLDRYHISKKLEQRVFVSELIDVFQKAINQYSYERVRTALDTLESYATTSEQEEHVKRLTSYLRRNWKIIKPHHIRDLTKEKEGIGIMESLHRILTFRMKRNSKYWGIGLEPMAWLLTTKRNGTLKEIFLEKWKSAFELDDRIVSETGNQYNHFFEDEKAEGGKIPTARINFNNRANRMREIFKYFNGE
ncbi:ISLre2 family transposase [Enterococcus hirae]|uniref:ISLre2 family transposase n=1 Tax=Enterococcus hirae TaxID=1354 RepID=UPI001F00ABF8|nr:ISLre2 family transposase [Enterococcus hirae]